MLGREIRNAREAAEMTQEQLAFEAGLDRTYISQLENDKKSPTIEVLFRIADSCGVLASEIIARVEAKKRRSGRRADE
jgi:transcriptional regulator with XRE-family HTH domain